MPKNTFTKKERLSGQKCVNDLFTTGKSFFIHPFIFQFKEHTNSENNNHNRFLISVSKRNHKTAVARNLIKRRIRESVRLNKQIFNNSEKHFDIGIVYTSKDVLMLPYINKRIKSGFKKIIDSD